MGKKESVLDLACRWRPDGHSLGLCAIAKHLSQAFPHCLLHCWTNSRLTEKGTSLSAHSRQLLWVTSVERGNKFHNCPSSNYLPWCTRLVFSKQFCCKQFICIYIHNKWMHIFCEPVDVMHYSIMLPPHPPTHPKNVPGTSFFWAEKKKKKKKWCLRRRKVH